MNFFNDNLGLYLDYYELTMAQGYFLTGRGNLQANLDYFFRDNPFNLGYTVFTGHQDLLELVLFKYSESSIDYLHHQKFVDLITQLKQLRNNLVKNEKRGRMKMKALFIVDLQNDFCPKGAL